MDWKKFRLKTDRGLRSALRVVAPTVKVIGEATKIISTIQKPGLIAVTNAVASGLGTLSDLVTTPDETPGYVLATHLSQGQIEAAFTAAGWVRESYQGDGERGKISGKYQIAEGVYVRTDSSGQIWAWDNYELVVEAVRRAMSAYLPPALQLVATADNKKDVVSPLTLTSLTPPETPAIVARIRALLGTRRAVLIEGRPGVGKTTLAQAIARDIGLGRTLLLDNTYLMSRIGADSLNFLGAGVVIIDDIDKVSVALSAFERVRNSCRLLICTANNGLHDSVIDAALARPARLDEVFTIAGHPPFQRAPFDRLPAKVWDVVSQWPQAYLNELELRLINTPDDVRLKELAVRLNKRTRSVEGMMNVTVPEPDTELWMDEPEGP